MKQKAEVASISRIAKASTPSNSIRTIIPEEMAKYLELDVKDILIWDISLEKGKKRLIVEKWER